MKGIYFAIALAVILHAQEQHKLTVDPATVEGKELQAIIKLKDPAAQQPLMEKFLSDHPQHRAAPWVAGQLQSYYLQKDQFDEVLRAGEKGLAVAPDDLDLCYNNLKAAAAKKDAALVKTWAGRSSAIARKSIAEGQPNADYARQVDTYSGYALYATALQMTDWGRIVDLYTALQQLNPESPYLPKLYGKYLNGLRFTGQAEKAGITAAGIAEKDTSNEDVLMIAADYYLQKKTDPDKVIRYSDELFRLLSEKPKPNGVSDADWDRKKTSTIALARWMKGISYNTLGQYAEADKELRAALPDLKDEEVRAIDLYHLGVANYHLAKGSRDKARLEQALDFMQQSAVIKSPLQPQAQKMMKTMRGEPSR